jgi:hypothetical protein
MARGFTLEDLTKGLLNYRFTGLTFERSEMGALRCVWYKMCLELVGFDSLPHRG